MTAPTEPVAVLLDTIWHAHRRGSCDKATAIDHMRFVAALTEADAADLLDGDTPPSVRYGRVTT